MLFPTLSFAVFFAIVLPASWLLMPSRVRWRLFMVAASWFFYGAADWRFVALLAGSTIANHVFARQIDRRSGRSRSAWTAGAVTANLVVLGWFKYIGFLALSGQSILNLIGLPWKLPLPDVALPVGISFFTFQALSYVIDTGRGKVRPGSLLDFAVYLSFFPHLVAGPIVRASEFLPQIRRRIDPRKVDAGKALWLISLGLFKKVVIASYLATKAADPLFGFPHQHGGLEALFGVYAYAIQIYADFSGYTDIAIGLALLLGIQFPQNFNAPYAAISLQDFWRRWHMTLSRWLRDYLYIPLGGNRRNRKRTYVNLMVTMLLGGLWHGAAWTFVVWGGLHGAGLAAERWLQERRRRAGSIEAEEPSLTDPPPPPRPPPPEPVPAAVAAPAAAAAAQVGASMTVASAEPISARPAGALHEAVILPAAVAKEADPEVSHLRMWLGRLVTFHLVCLAWIFFRATSFHNAVEVMSRIVPGRGAHAHLNSLVVATVVGALAAQFVPSQWAAGLQAKFSRMSIWIQSGSVAAALIVIDLLGPAGVAPFIYFRF
jgi:alginate O-acetyltransferase complex protein AlgI